MTMLRDASIARLLKAEFPDVEALCAAVRSWDLDFRPLVPPVGLDSVGRITQQRCGSVEIGYARFIASIDQGGAPPADTLTFVVPGQSMRRLWWRGHDVDARTVMVFPVGGELRSFSGPDFEVYTISVAEKLIARICERFALSLPHPRLRSETFQPPPTVLASVRGRLSRLQDAAVVGSALELEANQLIEELVVAWLDSSVPEPSCSRSMRVRDRAIRKCLERIEQADWTELTPGILCEVGEVGERTLQYAFRERFGLTPAAFLKMRRLAEVRNRLVTAGGEELMVGEVASFLGFWHVGQFAADYRRAFGETPSETLRRPRSR